MKKKLIIDKIIEIQNQYLELLKRINFKELPNKDFDSAIESIKIFWMRNKSAIFLFMTYHCPELETYVHTGNGMISIDDREHYTFVMLGKLHIVDDPISKVSFYKTYDTNQEFKQNLILNVRQRAEKTIKLLEDFRDKILVLPFSSLLVEVDDFINAEELFFSMFVDNSITNDNILQKFNSIDELITKIHPAWAHTITFSDSENVTPPLSQRFYSFLESPNNPLMNSSINEILIFKAIVISHIKFCITILERSILFKFIPFVQSPIIFRYIITIMHGIKKNDNINNLMLKTYISHFLVNIFNTDELSDIEFEFFYHTAQKVNFTDIILDCTFTQQLASNSSIIRTIPEKIKNLNKSIKKYIHY